jgi:hypothetical protein
MDFLVRFDRSEPYRYDPSGEHRLTMAKRLRREVLREGGEQLLLDRAEQHFGLPRSELAFSDTLAAQGHRLFTPGPADSFPEG